MLNDVVVRYIDIMKCGLWVGCGYDLF